MRNILQALLAPDTKLPRWAVALLVVGLLLLAWAYWTAAVSHGERNNLDPMLNDQKVYMNGAATMVSTNYTYSVPRLRMPGYMLLLSVVADPADDHVAFFPLAKRFNVVLSMLCLGVLFFALRPWLGNSFALCFVLMAAAQLYILRAAYVQPEILLFTMILLGVVLLVEVLREPVWWKALLAGMICCGWHMTKASALVAVGSFIAALLVKVILVKRAQWKQYLLGGLLVLVGYTLPMTPYLLHSHRFFGSAFYNSQSKYYMWGEDEAEKHRLQKSGVDRDLKAISPEELAELPTAQNYLKTHTLEHAQERLAYGTLAMINMLIDDYTVLSYFVMAWLVVMLWPLARRFDLVVTDVKSHWPELVYAAGLVVLFTFLYGWFTQLKVGPRLIASVGLIPIYFSMALVHHYLRGESETVFGIKVSLEKLMMIIFFIPWVILTIYQLPADLAQGYFGN
jgi:hypothetical protein